MFRCGVSNGTSQQSNGASQPSRPSRAASKQAPLLLHFDVNKTVIQSDSVQMKSVEEGIREGIADLFWGIGENTGNGLVWNWIKGEPSCTPPVDDILSIGATPLTYTQFCKKAVKDKAQMEEALRSFSLVKGKPVETEMLKMLQLTMKRMQLAPEVRNSKEAEMAGLKGPTFNMFPTLFHLVATLQRQRRPFALLFRSFGADHQKIQAEWNAFCELRHPIFSRLIEDIGPLDGTVAGIPDRRINSLHTLYRDQQGPVLLLDTFTNGPSDSWDAWARAKPKPTADTRKGREFVKGTLHCTTVEGVWHLRKWFASHLDREATAAIKDDWAWWQFHGEQAHAGKLMVLLGGRRESQQVFFDDNIDPFDARIVDCRDENGKPIPDAKAIDKYLVKVNPVEAMMDETYFFRKLLHSQGERLDVGSSVMGLQKQLTDNEEERVHMQKQLANMNQQLSTLIEENRRMKQQRRIQLRDENELRSLLAKEVDLKLFDAGGHRSIASLYHEIEQGFCWLQVNDQGKLVRVMDMLYLKICFNDMLLMVSYEQAATSRIQTRNYLPGVNMTLKDTSVQSVLDRWFESGLQVNIKECITTESLPVDMPDAPHQQSLSTQAYPLPCIVQHSQGVFVIPLKESEVYQDALAKIGLPQGKHFSTTSKDIHGESITRFWRWDKIAAFKNNSSQTNKGARAEIQDVATTCAKLFANHPRADVYQRLLLQMFETFEANKLCGGFSGSVVIRVQPFEADGRPGEPCIVKLDAGEAIREEFQNSANVFKALPDRAARILGDAVYGKTEDGDEMGAMRLELAGACWNVAELAQGSSNLLSTFKDLLLYESEQVLLGSFAAATDERPFGNMNSVLAETFGPGGIVSSLRKGGNGLQRAMGKPLVLGWYTLKGKDSKYNLYTAKKGEYPPDQAMRRLYQEYFGSELPNLKELVVGNIKPKLEQLAKNPLLGNKLCPLVGLAHGDLNAANIMIDALDAVWLIDFATSVDLPIFTDMCKFEMACLFEYATIPITPKLLLEFASNKEAAWQDLGVGDWLKIDGKVALMLLQKLAALPAERLSSLTQEDLHKLLDEVARVNSKDPVADSDDTSSGKSPSG